MADKKETKSQTPKKRLPRGLFYPAGMSDGCTAWRMEFPKNALNYSKHSEIQLTNIVQPLFKPDRNISEIYLNTDVVVMQRPVSKDRVSIAHNYDIIQKNLKNRGRKSFRFVIDVDDVIHGDYVSKFNVNCGEYFDNKRFNVFKEVVKKADELHVCSKFMRDFYKEEIGVDHVTHRPNLLPRYLYDHFDLNKSLKKLNAKRKPRIMWAGSATHIDVNNNNGGVDDFTHITDFIRKTIDKYQWVFFGGIPNGLEDLADKIEFHKWVGIFEYSHKIMGLDIDCMISPLFDNVFNRAKSNIKLTEAGALGIPCVCQDLDPYTEAPLKFNTADELGDQIDYVLKSKKNYKKILLEQKEVSDQYFIEDPDNMKLLLSSYYTNVGEERRGKLSPKLIDIN